MPKTKTADPLTAEKSKLVEEKKTLAGKEKLNKQETERLAAINARIEAIKQEKFVALAAKRTTRAINAVRGLQRLTNKASYKWTDAQANKICEALKGEVVDLHNRFKGQKKSESGFSLEVETAESAGE